jgi:hypothetical protein
MTVKDGEGAPEPTPSPDSDPDAGKWAALAKELETDDGGEPAAEPAPEPAPSPEPEPEPQPRGPVSPEEHENVQKALRQARENERQVREQLTGITGLIENLRQQRQQPKDDKPADEPKIPSKEEDPVGYFEAVIAQQAKQIEDLVKGTTTTQEALQQDQQTRSFWNAVIQSETEIRKTAPDYDEATAHLEQGRVAELKAIYADDNPQAMALARQYGLSSVGELRNAVLNQDRIAVAQQAFSLGMSPAQLYYNLAKQRGYQPKALNGQANGDAQKVAQAAIDAARKGQRAAKSIGGGTGGGPDNPLSIADLTELYSEDPEAFDKKWDEMARKGLLG